MTETHADFAIIGATPQARLVAGLLASAHGKSVVFQGESQAGYRLARGIDLSAAPLTRPESWAMLKAGIPETVKLISRMGKRATWSRIDPIFFADSVAGKEALAHTRHMASAFGIAAERVPATLLGTGREGLVLRDAVLLRGSAVEPVLDHWLDQNKVRRISSDDGISVAADGSAHCTIGDERIVIGQTVLADDSAIAAHLPAALWPLLLARQVASTILTEPTEAIAAPVMHQLDSGVVLTQQAERGIIAFGPGAIDAFAATLGTLLGRERAFRQAGQSSYGRVVTLDNGPAVGRANGTGPDILAGFGGTGAFLAPAIARWLSGVANETENAWFGARLVDRSADQSVVGEIGATR